MCPPLLEVGPRRLTSTSKAIVFTLSASFWKLQRSHAIGTVGDGDTGESSAVSPSAETRPSPGPWEEPLRVGLGAQYPGVRAQCGSRGHLSP